jgi:hypothetical protein
VHLLARPHLATMLLVAVSVWMVQADLRRPSRRIWLLLPITVLWTNLHGGWLAVVAIAGLTSLGVGVETLWGTAQWASARRYALLAAGCFSASILNPYGWRLHQHMAEYLTADWIKEVVMEFQSPTFRSENMLQYEIILLASCVAAGMALLRRQAVGPLLILFWAHSSLVSGRHVPLFVAVALPFLADELQELWRRWTDGSARNSVARVLDGLAREIAPGLCRTSVWAAVPFVLIALQVIPMPWRDDFPAERFPTKMAGRYTELLSESRVFTEDQWADYLLYRFTPRFKAFFDGRSDYYGETRTREYQRIVGAHHDYRQLLDKYRIDVVLAKPGWALAMVLKQSQYWRLVADDKQAILFQRVSAANSGGRANEKP